MSATSSSDSKIEVTIKHTGDLSEYEAPLVTVTKGDVLHPLLCTCDCGSRAGGGSGHSSAD